jgi:hypothetical protein
MFEGDEIMAADAKSYSTATVPFGVADQSDTNCDQGMEALVINEDQALSPESAYIPREKAYSASDDSQVVLRDQQVQHATMSELDSKPPQISPVHCVSRTAHSSNKPARSPAHAGGHRPYSLVEERAKRFGERASKSDTAMINNGSATIPFVKRSAGYSSDGSLVAGHISHNVAHAHSEVAVSRLSKDSAAEGDKNLSASVDDTIPADISTAVMPWSKSPVCQAPPPAEIISLPSAPIAAMETLPGIFYEPATSYHSVRVEPSPERILATFGSIDEEEEIMPITASFGMTCMFIHFSSLG